jgi:hypothetical protein
MDASSIYQQGDTQMTITHDAQNDFQIPGRSLADAICDAPAAVFRTLRRWHLEAVQKRVTANLPAHLQSDIGEIDHLPTTTLTSTQSELSSYQDRLQQMWMR